MLGSPLPNLRRGSASGSIDPSSTSNLNCLPKRADNLWVNAGRLARTLWVTLGLLLAVATGTTSAVSSSDSEQSVPRNALRSPQQTYADHRVREVSAGEANIDIPAVDFVGQTAGAPGEQLPTAIWNLTDEDPLVLAGYTNSATYEVALPAGWHVTRGASFRAEVIASTIVGDEAAVRIDIADRPAVTWNPSVDEQLRVPLSTELFAEPFSVTAATTSPLTDEVAFECFDRGHVARWFDLGLPRVEAVIEPVDIDVSRAMSGMGQISMLTGEPITVVLETESTPAMLEALGSVVAGVSQHHLPAGWLVQDQSTAQTSPGASIRLREVAGESGEVSVVVEDNRPILSVSGDAESLVAMADALADADRLTFMHASVVLESEVPAALMRSADEVFTFSDAGYDDRTLRGLGSQALVYRLHLPAGVPPDSATLALYATHAPALADQGATVSVQINGSAEEIVSVVDASGQLKVLHTVTPADLRPGLNFLKLRIELGSDVSACGAGGASGTNWLAVSNNSGIGVETPSRPVPVEIGVEDARFALATVVDFEQTDVAVVDDYRSADLAVAVEVISRLADRSQGGSPRLTTDSMVDTARHVVVSGAAQNRELLDSVPYLDVDNQVGLVAAKPSPFETGRVFLAFTGGTNTDSLRAVEAAMSSEVNDIETPYALVGRDDVRRVGDVPARLAFDDDGRVVGPSPAEYDDWLIEQAARIEAAREPERDRRRAVALTLAFIVAAVVAIWWLKRARSNDDVAASGH